MIELFGKYVFAASPYALYVIALAWEVFRIPKRERD